MLLGAPFNVGQNLCFSTCCSMGPTLMGARDTNQALFQFNFAEGGSLTDSISSFHVCCPLVIMFFCLAHPSICVSPYPAHSRICMLLGLCMLQAFGDCQNRASSVLRGAVLGMTWYGARLVQVGLPNDILGKPLGRGAFVSHHDVTLL